jgi:hypothetical protein
MAGTPLTAHERAMLGEWLGRYVYILVDPSDGIPFYVGRGVGARVAQHGVDAAKWIEAEEGQVASPKIARIRQIQAEGSKPEILIARRRIPTQTACNLIEATLIDLLLTFPIKSALPVVPLTGADQLTNVVRGEGVEDGLEALSSLIRDATAPLLITAEPLLVISLGSWRDEIRAVPGGGTRLGHGWKAEWSVTPDYTELGDVVRCWWSRLNESNVVRRNVRHVVATYRSITRGLFKIEGSWEYQHDETGRRRGGFEVTPVLNGPLWAEVVGDKGHRLPDKRRGDQSPYRYWPHS